ncbi:MAG: polysulfide reductase NrfD [Gracilibacteraceae bacterium]|jgi:formate-dependent nitrite reductase membrane component NrfD|nr:polysulfide reductase NrfD [Gracilibacteraceae bacterium]
MNEFALQIDYKEQKEWSKPPMWLEMALGAVSGGLFIFSLVFDFALGAIIALLTMLIGKGGLLLADLGRPERFIKVLARPKESWISKGSWGLVLFAAAAAAVVAPLVIPGWPAWGAGVGKILAATAGGLAAFLIVYDGLFLSDSKGVSFWDNGVLPLVFGFSALVGGLGALMVLAPIGGMALSSSVLSVANNCVLLAAAASLFAYINSAANGEGGAKRSAARVLKGDLAQVFWVGTVGAGLGAPLLISAIGAAGAAVPAICWAVSGLLEITGVIATRYLILNAGVYSPVL